MIQYQINPERCSGCGLCAEVCPEQAILIAAKQACIMADRCKECGTCFTVCRRGAIQMVGIPVQPTSLAAVHSPAWRGRHRARRQRWRTAHGRLLTPAGSYPRENAS